MLNLPDKPVYRFADVEVDAPRGCVRRGGREVHLRQQSLRVLLYLLERRERLVTKEELFGNVWEGAAVTDNALTQCIREIRRTLGDDSRPPSLIKTFPKSGYRFVGTVEVAHAEGPATVEFEEVTSFQFEYERVDDGVPSGARGAATRESSDAVPDLPQGESKESLSPLPRATAKRGRRLAVAAACLSVTIVGALFALRFTPGFPDASRETPVAVAREPGRRVLAVMFFENRTGDPQADWMREGLADMLITDLSRSRSLSVLSRQQLHFLLERAGHRPGQNISLDEALGVAREVTAETFVTGSFVRLGEQVRVDAQVYDARSGTILAAEQTLADDPSQVLTQVSVLSAKLAARLGQAPDAAEAGANLAAAMTGNLEAYRCYSLALEKTQALQNREAIELLDRAVRLDPQFAMAYARIGYAYAVTWNFAEKAKPYLEKAFRLSGRLTEKDRLYIAAWYAIANFDFAGAIKSFREIVARYPLEVEAHLRLARLLRGEGRQEEALEAARRALAVDAGASELYNVLGLTYSDLGRHDEALAMFGRYVELCPDEPNAHDSLGMGYQRAGRYAEAVGEYRRALALDPKFDVALVHLGNAYFQQGRYREAVAQFRHYVEEAPSDFERARGYNSIAYVHLKRGELDEAERKALRARAYVKLSESYLLVALARGDWTKVEQAIKEYEEQSLYTERGVAPTARLTSWLRGSLSLRRGRADEAVENFSEALRQRPLPWHIDSFEDCLAGAYMELGRLDEAVAEYERVLSLNPNYPLASYHLAQAFERMGRRDEALAAYERFLRTWRDADADLPEVADARKHLLAAK